MRMKPISITLRMRIRLLQQAERPRMVSEHGGGGLQQQLQLSLERVFMITEEENRKRVTTQRIILMRNNK